MFWAFDQRYIWNIDGDIAISKKITLGQAHTR